MTSTSHTDDTFCAGLVSYTKAGDISQSAAPKTIGRDDIYFDFLTFLGIAQKLEVDFLPITWQPELDGAGRGGTSEIRQSIVMLRASYAFKRIMPNWKTNQKKDFPALITELAVLGHPSIRANRHVAALGGICWDVNSENDEVWPVLVFEKAQQGDLMAFMQRDDGRKLSFRDRMEFCIDIITGVVGMHSNSIAHGDIKPQNILVFETTVAAYTAKVADFGYSIIFAEKDVAVRMHGTLYWVAPEWHPRGFTTNLIGAKRMDVYSIGVLCLWLLFYNSDESSNSKFYEDSRSDRTAIVVAQDHVALNTHLDPQIKFALHQFFNRALQKEPQDRSADLNELLNLLAPKEAETHEVQEATDQRIDLSSEGFQIVPSMAQLYLADLRVRRYVVECLRRAVSRDISFPRSKKFALELAFCYKIGFGTPKDEATSKYFLRLSGSDGNELENRLSSIKESLGIPQFRETMYSKFAKEGYDSMIDFVEHYGREYNLDLSIRQYMREVADLRSVVGTGHPMLLLLITQLSQVLRGAGRLEQAREVREELDQVMKTVLGEEHIDTLSNMAQLAAIYVDLGRYEDAEKLQEWVLHRQESLLGIRHPITLESMGALSGIYRQRGLWDNAEHLQLQIIQIRAPILGQDHPDVLRSKSQLAAIYLEQRRIKEAEKLLVDLVAKRKAILGPKHTDTVSSINNLATAYHYQKRLDEAEELQSQVAEIKKEVLGPEHPSTLLVLSNLASTRKDLGLLAEAEELEVELLEIRTRVLGDSHSSTLTTAGNLALTYGLQERWEEAKELGKKVVDSKTSILGQTHPSTLSSVANLADAYIGLEQIQDAEILLKQAVQDSVLAIGTEHPITKALMSKILSLYEDKGR